MFRRYMTLHAGPTEQGLAGLAKAGEVFPHSVFGNDRFIVKVVKS